LRQLQEGNGSVFEIGALNKCSTGIRQRGEASSALSIAKNNLPGQVSVACDESTYHRWWQPFCIEGVEAGNYTKRKSTQLGENGNNWGR
jgi:hypothetical protein